MKASYKKYILDFKRPSGTSRGVLNQKVTYFLLLKNHNSFGIGECGLLKGLSVDDVPDYELMLQWVCDNISLGVVALCEVLKKFPSIQFGVEQVFMSLNAKDPYKLFTSDFTEKETPILINGLIWMGEEAFMEEQIQKKLNEGFRCIKMKIGAIDFEKEYRLLKAIRKKYPKEVIELRVDANGAFTVAEAMDKLERLAQLGLHSIEQPIRQQNLQEMKTLCAKTPLPVALDEELIGIFEIADKEKILQTVQPQYIILKPSLVGGFKGSMEWISLAKKYNIGWWITSALESNVGLNAIAQWTFTLNNNLPQGLGTGGLYTNNFDSPLSVEDGALRYRLNTPWKNNLIESLCI
ncbi:o-succinylbenzoate synthase [bacterium]|nr:o-succinylbenzoate synthase [bacterium]